MSLDSMVEFKLGVPSSHILFVTGKSANCHRAGGWCAGGFTDHMSVLEASLTMLIERFFLIKKYRCRYSRTCTHIGRYEYTQFYFYEHLPKIELVNPQN
jgi:hypothetical protein